MMAKIGSGKTANGGTHRVTLKSSPAQKRVKNENNKVIALEGELKKLFPRTSFIEISKFVRSPIGADCIKEFSKENKISDLKKILYKNWSIWPKEITGNFRNSLPSSWEDVSAVAPRKILRVASDKKVKKSNLPGKKYIKRKTT